MLWFRSTGTISGVLCRPVSRGGEFQITGYAICFLSFYLSFVLLVFLKTTKHYQAIGRASPDLQSKAPHQQFHTIEGSHSPAADSTSCAGLERKGLTPRVRGKQIRFIPTSHRSIELLILCHAPNRGVESCLINVG